MELVDKYRRRKKRATELPRAVSLLLAWEGALVAGAFLAAIAHVAASAYMMERFDERTRRTSLVRYYQQRTQLADEAVRGLQASIAYYSRHAAAVERQLECSTAAARECQRRLADRRQELEQELAAALGLPPPQPSGSTAAAAGGAGVGGAGGDSSSTRSSSSSSSSKGVGGPMMAAALAPWRALYVRWRLDSWRRELERLDSEARQLERSLLHDQRLAEQARDKLRSLARELRREAAAHEALQGRLRGWRSYSCRSLAFSVGAQTEAPSWWRGLSGLWRDWRSENTATGDDSQRGAGLDEPPGESLALAGAGCGEGRCSSAAIAGHDGGGGGGAASDAGSEYGHGAVLWCWTMQVYVPAWMDDDEGFDFPLPPPPPRGEAPGDCDLEEGDGEKGTAAASEGDFLSGLRLLLDKALPPRW